MLSLLAGIALAAPPADLVVRHAAIRTQDPDMPAAEALAVRDGEVVWLGPDGDADALVGPETEVIDAGGRLVLPGFVDAHVHPAEAGIELGQCALGAGKDTEALLALVRACDEADPGRGWLLGAGWDLTAFPEGNPPPDALDRAVPDRPVFLESADGHSAWVNTPALAAAHIDARTPDPPGGRIERGPDGRPTGTLREDAIDLVSDRLPDPSTRDWEAGLRLALAQAARYGVTSLLQAKTPDRTALRAYRRLDRRGELTVRATVALTVEPPLDPAQLSRLVATRRRLASARVRPTTAKIFVDGVIESRTAAMLAPYTDTGEPGAALWTEPDLDDAVEQLAAAGFAVHLHAIGDRAVRMSLDAIAAARARHPDLRSAIAHLEAIDPADLPRFAETGAAAVFQPLWAYPDAYIVDLTVPGLGPERSEALYPIGAVARTGALLAFGSDWSVSSLDPLQGIEVAVTRRDPGGPPDGPALGTDQAIDADQAIAAYTRGAARAIDDPDAGVLRLGSPADLVVLSADPRTVAPEAIGDIEVLLTLSSGRPVWQAPAPWPSPK